MSINKFGRRTSKYSRYDDDEYDEFDEQVFNFYKRRLINVKDPVDDGDVVNKKYLIDMLGKISDKLEQQIKAIRDDVAAATTVTKKVVDVLELVVLDITKIFEHMHLEQPSKIQQITNPELQSSPNSAKVATITATTANTHTTTTTTTATTTAADSKNKQN